MTDRTDLADERRRQSTAPERPTDDRGGLRPADAPETFASGARQTAVQGSVSVQFEDQTSRGLTVTIASIETENPVEYSLSAVGGPREWADGTIPAGTYEAYTIELDEPLTETRELRFSVYPAGGGEALTNPTATVTIPDDVAFHEGFDVTRIDANPDAGFEYPYFLYAPTVPEGDAGGPLLIEPNNTGMSTNDFSRHREAARLIAEGEWNGGTGRVISNRLGVPFMAPAFPRPDGDPVDYTVEIHLLDTDTMELSTGPLANVDEQLLAMAEDARSQLSDRGYPVAEGLMLNGFSGSGTFVNRFAALHPEPIASVTAGGINGMPILPVAEAKGHTVNYQIGVADVEELTGEPFDTAAFAEIDQFLYLGELDGSDTIGFPDAWDPEPEAIALDIFGPNMQRDRLPYAKSVYEAAGIDGAVFRIYEQVGHNPVPVVDDLVAFHRRALEGGDTAAFAGNVGEPVSPRAAFTVATDRPTAGEPVRFDAGDAVAPSGEIVAYAWQFGDGTTGSTATPERTFEAAGAYDVRLRVVDSHGGSDTVRRTVEVEGGGGS